MPTKAHWSIFLPALCLYPIWLAIGLGQDLFATIPQYYPIGLAMIVGSMIAGSTPLGGGIVAFPVALLVLGFSSAQGRDASLLIQAVGMSAASYMILYKNRHLINGCEDLLPKFIVFSTVGLVIGFELLGGLSPLIVEIVYATLVVCVVFVFMYQDFINAKKSKSNASSDLEEQEGTNDDSIASRSKTSSETLDVVSAVIVQRPRGGSTDLESGNDSFDESPSEDGTSANGSVAQMKTLDESEDASIDSTNPADAMAAVLLQNICLALFAIVGGILSSLIGSGADVACYLYGSFVYCRFGPKRTQIGDNSLTATSVIVMASMSVFGSVLRVASGEVDTQVYYAWFSCAPIVVLGAPTGSLFLTPANQRRLKYGFYALGLLQLLLFGVIKIGGHSIAWISIASCITAVLTGLLIHYVGFFRGKNSVGVAR